MKASKIIMRLNALIFFGASSLFATVVVLKIRFQNDLIFPTTVAMTCVIIMTLIFIEAYVSRYEDLKENIENRKILLGRPGSMATYQSAKKDMERFKKNKPIALIRIVEFLVD